jgi:hypothetical protein
MSYCRWGDGDLYIYEDVHGGLTCCACKLLNPGKPALDADATSFHCPTRSALIAHVEEHLAAGHDVQKYVAEYLRGEIARLGDLVHDGRDQSQAEE